MGSTALPFVAAITIQASPHPEAQVSSPVSLPVSSLTGLVQEKGDGHSKQDASSTIGTAVDGLIRECPPLPCPKI